MDNLTDQQLSTARFFVKHEIFWRRLAIFTLFFVDLILIYTLALRLTLYLNGELAHQRVLRGLQESQISLQDIHRRSLGQPVRVISVRAVPADQGRSDVIAEIINPNQRLLAESVVYQLVASGTPEQPQTTFVLPEASKNLLFFDVPGSSSSANYRVEVLSTSWRRVNLFEGRQDLLRDIQIRDLDWGRSEGGFKVSGQVVNSSGRGFWSLGLPIKVLQGSQVVGLNYVTLLQLEPGETRLFEASWPHAISRVTSTEVQLEANVYDDAIFMAGGALLPDPSGID